MQVTMQNIEATLPFWNNANRIFSAKTSLKFHISDVLTKEDTLHTRVRCTNYMYDKHAINYSIYNNSLASIFHDFLYLLLQQFYIFGGLETGSKQQRCILKTPILVQLKYFQQTTIQRILKPIYILEIHTKQLVHLALTVQKFVG